MPATAAAFDRLERTNTVASLTVRRDGEVVFARASGELINGSPATPDSPMVVASVSKLITAFTIAKLEQGGLVALDAPVPWNEMGISPHPDWNDVTVRSLLSHTSGMPVSRTAWFTGGGDCQSLLSGLLNARPQAHRGTWRYSNGNYCALGLLIEAVTGDPLDAAAQRLVFDPLAIDGAHLTTNGLLPTDAPHGGYAERLTKLGGAGAFVVSTDDMSALLEATTPDDIRTLQPPGVFSDQYGWGHTGTVTGAISCAWTMDTGRTTIAVTISGNSPSTGGALCDRIIPAVGRDLGIDLGTPSRLP